VSKRTPDNLLTQAERNALIEKWAGLPSFVAKKLIRGRFTQVNAQVDYDEALSIGGLALVKSARKWDPNRGILFSTYACRAISCDVYHIMYGKSMERNSRGKVMFSRVSSEVLATVVSPDDDLCGGLDEDSYIELTRAVKSLEGRDKKIVDLYYYNSLTYKQVGEHIGVTRERVRQLLGKVIKKLRLRLGGLFNGTAGSNAGTGR
jgi:RNA polymerase sigma factor (sigma-70 family)